MSKKDVLHITLENYKAEVVDARGPIVLDFWAPWCQPCKILSPIVDELAKEVVHVKFAKINIAEQPELAKAFKVSSIPMITFMNEGKILEQTVGLKPKKAILDILTQKGMN